MTERQNVLCDSTNVAAALNDLRSQPSLPHDLGVRLALFLSKISTLVKTHLSNTLDFRQVHPNLHFAPKVVRALDEYIVQLRMKDGLHNAFPDYVGLDRKERRRQRRCAERMVKIIESVYKACVIDVFEDLFIGWTAKETQMFNNGVEVVLNGADWYVYPEENVVMKVREGNWGVWLREQCVTIGHAEVQAGKRKFAVKPIEGLPVRTREVDVENP